jgi:hypothetical protein
MAGAGPATMKPRVPVLLHQHEQQGTCQSVGAPNVNSLPLDNNMLRIVIVAQQFVTEFNGAVRRGENSGHYKNYLKPHEAK